MNSVVSAVDDFLCLAENHFATEKNKLFRTNIAELYAFRKAGMAGRDYVFIHFCEQKMKSSEYLQLLHEEARNYVNGLYKLPKVMRFKVPCIISVFVSAYVFPDDAVKWATTNTRSILGGEFHAAYLIDISNRMVYGQGKNQVFVKGGRFEFSKIDPQNRALNLAHAMGNFLFERF